MSLGGGKGAEEALAELQREVSAWKGIANRRGALARELEVKSNAFLEAYKAIDIVLTPIEVPKDWQTGSPCVDKILELLRRLNEAEVRVAELEAERRAVRDGAKPGGG